MVRRHGGKQVEYSRIFLFPKVVSPSGNRRGIPHPTPCREPARNHHPLPFPPGTGTGKRLSLEMRLPFGQDPGKRAAAHFRRRPSASRAPAGRDCPPPSPPRTWGIASFSPDNSLSWHGISMRPEEPWLPDSPQKTMQGLALSGPEPISKRIRLAGSAFCPFVQKSPRACTSWPMSRRQNKGRCGLLPRPCGWRAGGKKTNRAKADKIAVGKREVEIYKTVPNAAPRTRMPGRGGESTLKTMKTASRTWKEGGRGWKGIVRQFQQFPTMVLETTWTTRDNSFKVPGGQLRPAEGCEWNRQVNMTSDKWAVRHTGGHIVGGTWEVSGRRKATRSADAESYQGADSPRGYAFQSLARKRARPGPDPGSTIRISGGRGRNLTAIPPKLSCPWEHWGGQDLQDGQHGLERRKQTPICPMAAPTLRQIFPMALPIALQRGLLRENTFDFRSSHPSQDHWQRASRKILFH